MLESELWQLYRTDDDEKMGRLFEVLATEVDDDVLEYAITEARGDN